MFKRLILIYTCMIVVFIGGCKNSIDNPIPEIKGKLSIIEGIPVPPGSNGIIVYAVVFEPNKMLMHVAISENGEKAPFCKKVSFDITELLDGLN